MEATLADENSKPATRQPLPVQNPAAGQPGHDPSRAAVEQANQSRRAAFQEEKKAVAERPQQVGDPGQKPTPTQQENDELRAGLRHIDDKEDDGSGPDLKYVRRFEAAPGGKYETR